MIDQKNMLETVSTMEMDYEDFIRLLEVPMQRNTEERLKTAKHLRVLRPEHCIVHLVRLTKDCTVKGKLYRKGTLMRVDSNNTHQCSLAIKFTFHRTVPVSYTHLTLPTTPYV